MQRAAAQVLSETKNAASVDHFIDSLKDSSTSMRETAARSLGKLGDVKALKYLINTLNDPESSVREEAAAAIGEIGNDSAIKPLLKAIKDPNPNVRIMAVKSIGKIKSQYPEQNSAPIVRALNKCMTDSEAVVKSTASEALAKIYMGQKKFDKAAQNYKDAAKIAFVWDYHQSFYEACSNGLKILEALRKDQYSACLPLFAPLSDLLHGAARSRGVSAFISEYFWKATELFVKGIVCKDKEELMAIFRDYGLALMLIQKKLPEDLRPIAQSSQDDLNTKLQIIGKKPTEIPEIVTELKTLKEGIFDLGVKLLQLEPLEIRTEDTQDTSSAILDTVMITPNILNETSGAMMDSIQSNANQISNAGPKQSITRNFELEELTIGKNQELGEAISVALIQQLRGSKRMSLIEENKDIFFRGVERYS